jgi:MFS family permease
MRGRPPASSRPSLRKALEVFRYRHYRFLWISSAFSFTGMQMQQIARAVLAWELTHSYGAVGAVSLSFGLPMLCLSLIGGSLADRFEKRNLTLMTQAATGVLALVTAILVFTDVITIQMLIGIGLVQGTFFAFGMPARTPLMAEVVGPENVMSAIAMSNAAMNATRLFGPALAGGLIVVSGISAAYFVQAFFYVCSTAILLQVPTGLSDIAHGGMRPRPQGNMFVEIGRGLRYVGTHPRLRLLFAMLFIVTFFAMPYIVLLPGFVDHDLGRGGGGAFGILQSVSGAGALVGSLGVATLTAFDRKPLVQWIAGICGGAGLILLALGSASFGFAGAIVAVVILGLALTAYQTLNNTMLMDEARPEYYGRVMSINMATFSAMPMMALPLGALADSFGARETFLVQGAIVLAFMALVGAVNSRYTFRRQSTTAWREGAAPGPAAVPATADSVAAPQLQPGPEPDPVTAASSRSR